MFEDIALYFVAFQIACSMSVFALGVLVGRNRERRAHAASVHAMNHALTHGALSPNEYRDIARDTA